MNHERNKKLRNKGFSFIELIIVVAIMAILIAVLAPQYLRYVERARNATDQNNAAAIESALLVWGVETDTTLGTLYAAGDTASVTITAAGGVVTGTGTGQEAATDALDNAGIDVATLTCESRTDWTSYTVTATVNANGTVNVDVTYNP